MCTGLDNPQFLGKLVVTADDASTWVLATTEADPYSVLIFQGGTTESAPRWSTYDAGNGNTYLTTEDGRFVGLVPGSGILALVRQLDRALPIQIESWPATVGQETSGSWQVYWEAKSQWLEVSYSLDVTTPTLGLVQVTDAAASASPTYLTTLRTTLVTPGLASILSSGSAVDGDLAGVDLSGADLSGIDFTGADLHAACLGGTIFSGDTNLTSAQLDGIDLTAVAQWGTGIQAGSASLRGCLGRGITIGSTSIKPASFENADFTDADLSGAVLNQVDLSGAVLSGANFSGAQLAGASLAGITGGENQGSVGINLSWAYLADANLREAHLEGADLSGVQAYFTSQGSFANAFLTGTNLGGADLTGMPMTSVEVAGALFDRAILIDCQWSDVAFVPSSAGVPVSMAGAWLTGSSFDDTCVYDRLNLTGAQIADTAGVPLFDTPASDYAVDLDDRTLPSNFPQLFADSGLVLSPEARVSVITSGTSWSLRQDPTQASPGIEIVGYALRSDGTTLSVYTNHVSLVEQTDGRISYALSLQVTPTQIFWCDLDRASCLPNGATMDGALKLRMNGFEALAAPRLPLARL